jgi:putative ABC transport system permease protein
MKYQFMHQPGSGFLAWAALRTWLGNFAFRIDPTWTIFALSTSVGLGAALASVAWQSLRAARADPVNSLRFE